MQVTTFKEAEKYLYDHIPYTKKYKYPADLGIKRTKRLVELLGNPQEKIKVIHVAGTSGKGSTSYLVSVLLQACGFSTGLYIKPHILDIRERFQINNAFLSEEKFIFYVNQVIPFVEEIEKTDLGMPTYFEINVALAYYIFYKEKIDYAVIETGLGGLYDGTNVVENKNKFFVISKIGFDHTEILGNTYKEIAFQKAGIIKPFNQGISIGQQTDAENVIAQKVEEKNALMQWLRLHKNISNIHFENDKTVFDFRFGNIKLDNLHLGLLGTYQAENVSLALATAILISKRDNFKLDFENMRKVLNTAHLPARFELREKCGKTLIIDGAHNPQKIEAMLETLDRLYPNKKFDFLVAFKKEKDIHEIIRQLLEKANHITVTSYFTKNQEVIAISEDLDKIEKNFKEFGFTDYTIIPDSKNALEYGLDKSKKMLIITGSMYFISELYSTLK